GHQRNRDAQSRGGSGAGRGPFGRSRRRHQQRTRGRCTAHRKNPRTRIERAQGQRMYFLVLNPAYKPFDNKLVRQAFNYAIDPSVIVKHIYEGNGYVMDGPVASNVIGADPRLKRYPLDPKKAKEFLVKAGYPNGVDVKLYLSPDRYPKAREVC